MVIERGPKTRAESLRIQRRANARYALWVAGALIVILITIHRQCG